METNKTIEQVLENLDKNVVYKTRNSALPGFLLFIAGIVSFVIYTTLEWKQNSIFPQILFVLGTICLITGIFKFFFRKRQYVSATDHSKIECFELYFHVNERDRLLGLLQNGDFTKIKDLKSSIVDGLKLRILATKNGHICFSQAIAFITSEYVAITPVREHTMAEYQNFLEIYVSRK